MKVAVIGTGYVGLTTGVVLGFLGHEVVGVDKDPAKLDMLRAGKSPIHELGLNELLALSKNRISFSDDTTTVVRDSDVIIIAVGTPSQSSGAVDVSYVEQAALEIAGGLESGRDYTVVVKSTVPIGTNRRVAYVMLRTLEERGVIANLSFASNPEFLREGKALFDTLYPDRIVVGSKSAKARDSMRSLYERILSQSFTPPSFLARERGYSAPAIVETDPTSAEMIKYAANAFLAVKISFINEIGGLCDRAGADVTEVSRGIGLDQRIGPLFLNAGLGWGGSCFPKDTLGLIGLASEYGYTMPVVTAAREVNQRQQQVIVEKLQSELKVLRGRVIALLGLAFKPDTDDVRYSPALGIIQKLAEFGAIIRVTDPIAMANAKAELANLTVEYIGDPSGAVRGADAFVLTTEWGIYRDLDLGRVAKAMRTPVLIDGRNLYEPETATEAGLRYTGVGR